MQDSKCILFSGIKNDRSDILAIAVDMRYNINRQNDRKCSWSKAKTPVVPATGVFYSVMGGWLNP